MPTQRSFLGNFLAAFRAHSTQPLSKTSPSSLSASTSTTTTTTTSAATIWTSAQQPSRPQPQPQQPQPTTTSETTPTTPKPIPTTKQDQRHLHPPLSHTVSPQTHLPRHNNASSSPIEYPTCQQTSLRRRGSDSSSDSGGFRENSAGGGEKWFIGGRTGAGEEKYYKLGMVRRERREGRLSADRLSL